MNRTVGFIGGVWLGVQQRCLGNGIGHLAPVGLCVYVSPRLCVPVVAIRAITIRDDIRAGVWIMLGWRWWEDEVHRGLDGGKLLLGARHSAVTYITILDFTLSFQGRYNLIMGHCKMHG